MPISVSTDPIRPAERTAYWTEAICRSFASVETRPLGSAVVSGHFEFVQIGGAKLVRFDSSPQCYTRDARLVNLAGSDEFMFDFQRRGRSSIVQAGNEGTIEPGYGVLYDARRPFEDRLFGPEPRVELLIATVPASKLLRSVPDAERLCAKPVALSGTVARAIAALVRDAIAVPDTPAGQCEPDIVALSVGDTAPCRRGKA
jgi:AraC family transcriptional regulator, positive regulator of tynA and feaB